MPRSRRTSLPLPRLPSSAAVSPHARLAALRTERRLSIARLAALAGLRPTTISDLERGTTLMPRQRTLEKLAAVYGLPLEELQREIGMVGPRYELPALQRTTTDTRTFSPCAEEIGGLVDTLPAPDRQFVLAICQLLHARHHVELPMISRKETR